MIDKNQCPEGYKMAVHGKPIDMLGATQMWRIFEHHPDPHLTRIPQDLVDYSSGPSAKRIPEEWGKCLYYKLV
jgi:hypothetical protein